MASRQRKMDPVRVQVLVSPATYAALKQLAQRYDKSLSWVTDAAIVEGLPVLQDNPHYFPLAGTYQKKGFAQKDRLS